MNVIENIVNRVLEDYGMRAELVETRVNRDYISWFFDNGLTIVYSEHSNTLYVRFIKHIAELLIKELRKHILFRRVLYG